MDRSDVVHLLWTAKQRLHINSAGVRFDPNTVFLWKMEPRSPPLMSVRTNCSTGQDDSFSGMRDLFSSLSPVGGLFYALKI